jgi:hypothetical protein
MQGVLNDKRGSRQPQQKLRQEEGGIDDKHGLGEVGVILMW